MALERFTHAVTLNGQTRDVEFVLIRDDYARSAKPVGKYCKGAGRKHWAETLVMFRGGPKGEAWRLNYATTILNRSGYALRGWADEITNASEHNSACRVPGAV